MPAVKWRCQDCGEERMMNAGVTLVLCQCNYKNMKRISKVKSSSSDSEGNSSLGDYDETD